MSARIDWVLPSRFTGGINLGAFVAGRRARQTKLSTVGGWFKLATHISCGLATF
ncbi:MAG: hypothetical protein JWN63_583 [Candidatus Acidoferrum typicum]|nr:hypothetical protein [Candidatus Acidoferrum typicum]